MSFSEQKCRKSWRQLDTQLSVTVPDIFLYIESWVSHPPSSFFLFCTVDGADKPKGIRRSPAVPTSFSFPADLCSILKISGLKMRRKVLRYHLVPIGTTDILMFLGTCFTTLIYEANVLTMGFFKLTFVHISQNVFFNFIKLVPLDESTSARKLIIAAL